MRVLYCDNHLLALDKPCGLLTQPSGTDRDSLEERARDYVKEAFHKPGAVFLEAVHRIDRVACGVVLFGRTSKALARLNDAMRQGRCGKLYRAIVSGCPKRRSGRLSDWLLHDEHHAEVVRSGTAGARECFLDYDVIKELPGGFSLLSIRLETGRYHQIRAQFAHAGHPLLGDVRYGGKACPPLGRDGIALQHYELTTPHPTRPEAVVIRSEIDLEKLTGFGECQIQ